MAILHLGPQPNLRHTFGHVLQATTYTSQEQGLAFAFRLDAEGHGKKFFQMPQRPDGVRRERTQPHFIDFLWPQCTQ